MIVFMTMTFVICELIKQHTIFMCYFLKHLDSCNAKKKKCLGYVCNPRSLMGRHNGDITETLCCDDIGDLPGSPDHL